MNVLFYADPAKLFEHYMHSAELLQNHLLDFCGSALLRAENVEVKAVISEIAGFQQQSGRWLSGLDAKVITIDQLRSVFPRCRSMDQFVLRYFKGQMTEDEHARLAELLRSLLGEWVPDVVIAYPTQIAPLQAIFPKALCLIMENGIFSRNPFPRSLRFEPVDFMNGFPARFKERIWSFPVDAPTRAKVEEFRAGLSKALVRLCPFAKELDGLRAKFRHLVLCPVPAKNFYGEAEWDDQLLWVWDVMKHVPSDVGVIITFHDFVMSQLNSRTLEFLQARHPNLFVFSGGRSPLQSAAFFPFVDAILNCETMTGIQGMLVCPRIVSLDKTYSAWAADSVGLDGLAEVLERPGADRTGLIFWYLTHFVVLDSHFGDAEWYRRYFQAKLDAFRRDGVTFEMFEQIEAFEDVAQTVLDRFRQLESELKRRRRRRRFVLRRWMRKAGGWLADVADWIKECGEVR